MNTKGTIKKILFVGMWLAIGTGMLTLLIGAMGKQKKDNCKDYVIRIAANQDDEFFLDQADILKLLKAATNGKIKGQPKTSFNLRRMEQLLKDNQWVKDAQLYFDNKDVLHISVSERQPMVRIFTDAGRSFYMDETGELMGLSDRLSVRLPVFTGFPDKKMQVQKDSLLRQDIISTARFVNTHPFWNSQVAQIEIGPSATTDFTMIPVVGNHVVQLGDSKNIEDKFSRLFIFYKQVLSKTGMDKYKSVDVRFAGQVIGRKSDNPKVDSVQLRKSVERLLEQIKEMEKLNDAEARLPSVTPMRPVMVAADTLPHPGETDSDRPITVTPPVENNRTLPKPAENRTPKAVMPRRG